MQRTGPTLQCAVVPNSIAIMFVLVQAVQAVREFPEGERKRQKGEGEVARKGPGGEHLKVALLHRRTDFRGTSNRAGS